MYIKSQYEEIYLFYYKNQTKHLYHFLNYYYTHSLIISCCCYIHCENSIKKMNMNNNE